MSDTRITTSIRLPVEMHRRVAIIAEALGLTVTDFQLAAITAHIENIASDPDVKAKLQEFQERRRAEQDAIEGAIASLVGE